MWLLLHCAHMYCDFINRLCIFNCVSSPCYVSLHYLQLVVQVVTDVLEIFS